MLDLGTLRVGITADTDKATSRLKGFQEQVEGAEEATKRSSAEIARATSTVSDAFGKVVAAASAFAAAATAAFALTVKSALDGYASYEQNIGGINKLFGTAGMSIEDYASSVGKSVDEVKGQYDTLTKSARQVVKDADSAWKDVGVSANTYMEQVTSFSASLITSLGGDTAKAAEYAKTAMVDMSDNANTFGTNISDIQRAYQGFAKQNYTMLDNLKLGYGGTKEEMERLISDANKVKEANGEMADLSIDSFADVVEAIHTMQEEMNIAGTTQREALTTIEGSVNAARAAWENWLTGLGNSEADMRELTSNLVAPLATAAGNILPRIKVICQALLAEIPNLFSQIKAMLPSQIQGVIDIIQGILPIVTGTVASISAVFAGLKIKSAIEGITGVVKALWVVLAANPVLAVVAAVAALTAAFATAYTTNEAFRNGVNSLVSTVAASLRPAIDALVNAFNNFANVLMANLQPLLAQVQEAFNNLGAIVLPILQTAFSILGPVILTVATNFLNMASTVTATVLPVITGLISLFNEFCTFITPLVQSALSVVQGVFDAVFPYIQQLVQSVFGIVQTHIQTVMGVIQGTINVILSAIKGDWDGVLNGLKQIATSVFNGIKGIVSNVLSAIRAVISGALAAIQSLWSSGWNAVSSFLSGILNSMKSAVSSGISGIVNFFSSLPGKILGALGNTGNLLVSAGKSIIDGFLSGLKSAFSKVQDFVGGIGSWIAAHKGPKAYDLALLVPNGGWIMESLATGLEKSLPLIKDVLDETASSISGYDFGTATVEADFNAYRRVRGTSSNSSEGKGSACGGTSITVNNYSPKSLTEKESAREFRKSVRQLAFT